MKCNVCGSDNVEGSIFCEDCGSKLSAPAPAFSAVPAAAAPAPFSPAPVAAAPTPAVAPTPAAAPVAASPFSAPAAPSAPAPAVAASAPAAAQMVCQACGASNQAGSKFCEDCGASLASLPAAPVAASPFSAPAQPAAPVAPEPAAAPAIAAPKLVMPNGVEITITAEHTLLGRQSPADNIYPEIDLTELDPESYVSRRHGQITRQASKFLYEDIGSSNGSWINGARLESKIQTELHNGDVLRLGRTEMTFRI
ncbi:MAG: FHA domain-containing protein [Candidatus Bruticola sp.]